MNIDDLVTGDVALFAPEKGSFISKAIVWLTGAPVSHAAMVYSDVSPVKLVEETPPAVRISLAAQRFPGRKISVMRFTSDIPLKPVIEVSSGFVNNEEPYAMDNLYLVGIVLLYRKVSPSGPVQRVILKILKKLTVEIMEYLDKHKYPDKEPMVCSQMVYECFQQAGTDYHLKVNSPLVQAKKALLAAEPASLLGHALTHTPAAAAATRSSVSMLTRLKEASPDQDHESLARELLDALEAEGNLPKRATDEAGIQTELLDAVHDFGQVLDAAKNRLPVAQATAKKGLSTLSSAASTFVTPADLLLHTSNLKNVGAIDIPET